MKKENLSTTVPKGPKAITKLIKGGLFLLALSAASSLQQLSYAQIAEAPGFVDLYGRANAQHPAVPVS